MVWEALAAVFEVLGVSRRRPREAFALRALPAPHSSAAHRDDFSHCWGLVNTGATRGANKVTFTWRRGPDGKPGEPTHLGTVGLMQFAPLDGITRPSDRPFVSGQVSWTEANGTEQRMIVDCD